MPCMEHEFYTYWQVAETVQTLAIHIHHLNGTTSVSQTLGMLVFPQRSRGKKVNFFPGNRRTRTWIDSKEEFKTLQRSCASEDILPSLPFLGLSETAEFEMPDDEHFLIHFSPFPQIAGSYRGSYFSMTGLLIPENAVWSLRRCRLVSQACLSLHDFPVALFLAAAAALSCLPSLSPFMISLLGCSWLPLPPCLPSLSPS